MNKLSYFMNKQGNKQKKNNIYFWPACKAAQVKKRDVTLSNSLFIFQPFHTSLIMFHFYFLQSTFHFIHFISDSLSHSHLPSFFGCTHITWSFNLTFSFTSHPISSREISHRRVSLDKFLILDIHYLKLNSGGLTTPCIFVLNNKYNSFYKWYFKVICACIMI